MKRRNLTEQQLLVAQYRCAGFSTKEAAELAQISPSTAHKHLNLARRRSGCDEIWALSAWLWKLGQHPYQAWPEGVLKRAGLAEVAERRKAA